MPHRTMVLALVEEDVDGQKQEEETRQAEARKSFADEVREKSRVWISQKRLESLTLTSPEPR